MLPQPIIEQLVAIVGESRLLLEVDDLQRFGVDRTMLWQAAPCGVVLPGTVEEVQSIVRLANQYNLAIVPSGGRTGLSGGAVAKDGELVVALDRINQVIEFNPVDRSVKVGAGMITGQLQQFAAERGLCYPVDFASSGSSQIGGNIATNAGGIKVIKYGMTRNWVAGLKVVNGAGDLFELNKGLAKNNTGYDLRHLFIGSEGTLGLICEATIQLAPAPLESSVMVLGIEYFPEIVDVLTCFSHALDLSAFEFFSQQALDKVLAHRGHAVPFQTETAFYALLEFEHSSPDVVDKAMELFEHCVDKGWVMDGVLSQSLSQAKSLWKLREDISETLWQWQPYKNDISVRISRMADFLGEVDQLVMEQYPDFEIIWYGHIGDGNLHLNILKPEVLSVDQFHSKCVNVNSLIGQLLAKYEGSVSAEHGVGLLKKDYLHYSRSEVEMDMMRSIKRAFDPNHIMNPGKLFDC
ncbi:putative FAD-linked oxidoreductase [Gammaproteobacteria bacterium MOLA455]|nr:putative FAD-linked oxidoreductase [Gammaproteobacteria bacterium MOLA455]